MQGIGAAVCMFPQRQAYSVPDQEHFVRVGDYLKNAICTEGPVIRRESEQMELPLERQKTGC